MALEIHILVFTDYDCVVWQVVHPFQSNMLSLFYILETSSIMLYYYYYYYYYY
jgi:hypothetical protein